MFKNKQLRTLIGVWCTAEEKEFFEDKSKEQGFDTLSQFIGHWVKTYLSEKDPFESINTKKFSSRTVDTTISAYIENNIHQKLKSHCDAKFPPVSLKKELTIFSFWLFIKLSEKKKK